MITRSAGQTDSETSRILPSSPRAGPSRQARSDAPYHGRRTGAGSANPQTLAAAPARGRARSGPGRRARLPCRRPADRHGRAPRIRRPRSHAPGRHPHGAQAAQRAAHDAAGRAPAQAAQPGRDPPARQRPAAGRGCRVRRRAAGRGLQRSGGPAGRAGPVQPPPAAAVRPAGPERPAHRAAVPAAGPVPTTSTGRRATSPARRLPGCVTPWMPSAPPSAPASRRAEGRTSHPGRRRRCRADATPKFADRVPVSA